MINEMGYHSADFDFSHIIISPVSARMVPIIPAMITAFMYFSFAITAITKAPNMLYTAL